MASRLLDTKVPKATGDLVPMCDHPGFTREVVVARSPASLAGVSEYGARIPHDVLCEAVVIGRYRDYLEDPVPVLRDFGRKIERLPELMRAFGVHEDIIEHRARSIEQHAGALMNLGIRR